MRDERRGLRYFWLVAWVAICFWGDETFGQATAVRPVLPDGYAPKTGTSSDPSSRLPLEIICTKDGSEMVLVPGGEFTVGAAEQEPLRLSRSGRREPKPGGRLRMHKVSLPSYYMDRFEVTNAQFAAFMQAGGYQKRELWSEEGWDFVQRLPKPQPCAWGDANFGGPRKPVAGVSFFEAEAYARWVGRSLPTEAEWEKAARGIDHRKYPWGVEAPSLPQPRCNLGLEGDGFPFTAPVGSFPLGRSPFGCEDMAGNVWEWCADWHDETHPEAAPPHGPTPEERKDCRPLRGGSWMSGEWDVDVDARHWLHRWYQAEAVGFRTVIKP